MGGQTDNPSYQDITAGRIGHVEVVQLIFDDAIITKKRAWKYSFNYTTAPNLTTKVMIKADNIVQRYFFMIKVNN